MPHSLLKLHNHNVPSCVSFAFPDVQHYQNQQPINQHQLVAVILQVQYMSFWRPLFTYSLGILTVASWLNSLYHSCGTLKHLVSVLDKESCAGLPDELEAELEEESTALLAAVDAQLCAQRQVCNGLAGDAHRAMDTASTGGAVSAGSPPPSADVIAAARCAWIDPMALWASTLQRCALETPDTAVIRLPLCTVRCA